MNAHLLDHVPSTAVKRCVPLAPRDRTSLLETAPRDGEERYLPSLLTAPADTVTFTQDGCLDLAVTSKESNAMQRFCLTLDLRPDPELIAEYIELHRLGRPEINQSIRDAGVLSMQIYELDARLFMIMDTTDDFTFERKARMDSANAAVQQWEQLMAKFQNVATDSDPTNRWRPMHWIYDLASTRA